MRPIHKLALELNHDRCIAELESLRWDNNPTCPHCKLSGAKKAGASRNFKVRKAHINVKTPNYYCKKCRLPFNVLTKTIFYESRMSLPKWFVLIKFMLTEEGNTSALSVQKKIGITYEAAWLSAMKVRCDLLDNYNVLEGIADISLTPKPTCTEIPADSLTGADLLLMLKWYRSSGKRAFKEGEQSITQFKAVRYSPVVSAQYISEINGYISKETLENTWKEVKKNVNEKHRVVSKKYLPFYLSEMAYKLKRSQIKNK